MASKKTDFLVVSQSTPVLSGNGAVAAPAPVAVAAPAPVAVAAPVPAKAPVAPAAAVAAPAVAAVAAVATAPRSVERDRSTVVTLIAKLRDSDAEVARDAAATLGKLPADAQAVDALGGVLRNADGYFHSVVRAAAAAALGSLGDKRAVDALIAATRDSMAETSEEAVKALGLLGDRRAIPALEQVVRNENGFFLENVRKSAQVAINRIRA